MGTMVPGGLLVGVQFRAVPLHTEVACTGTNGVGFTVTTKEKVAPVQFGPIGVTV